MCEAKGKPEMNVKDRMAAIRRDQSGEPITREEAAAVLADLIREIEKLPGSPQQTICGTKASGLWMKFIETSAEICTHGIHKNRRCFQCDPRDMTEIW